VLPCRRHSLSTVVEERMPRQEALREVPSRVTPRLLRMSEAGTTLGHATRPGAASIFHVQEFDMPSLNPYLSFKNEAREAMTFYQSVFGGDLDISTFGDYEGMVQDPAESDLVMHSQLTSPDGFVLMGADTPTGMTYEKPAGISVSVSGDDEPSLQGFWDKLADGGAVVMPFDTPPWGGRFGMLTDRFGIDWMIAVNAQQA
jgi:PhnB protein